MGNEREHGANDGKQPRQHAQRDAADPRTQMVAVRAARQRRAAGAYRRMLADKFDRFDATVDRACLIFEEAFRQEKRPKEPGLWTSVVIDTMTNEILKAVTSEFKVELWIVEKLSQYAQGAVKKGAKAQKGADDFAVISSILVDVRAFSHAMVHEAKAEIAAIPDAVAAANYKKYDEKVNSPAVGEAAQADAVGQDVQAAVQDEMLEANGAPITGASEAEVIAVRMLRQVKAEMIDLGVSPQDTSAKVGEALSDPAKTEIPAAESRLNMDQDVFNDQKSRERAEPLVKGNNS